MPHWHTGSVPYRASAYQTIHRLFLPEGEIKPCVRHRTYLRGRGAREWLRTSARRTSEICMLGPPWCQPFTGNRAELGEAQCGSLEMCRGCPAAPRSSRGSRGQMPREIRRGEAGRREQDAAVNTRRPGQAAPRPSGHPTGRRLEDRVKGGGRQSWERGERGVARVG